MHGLRRAATTVTSFFHFCFLLFVLSLRFRQTPAYILRSIYNLYFKEAKLKTAEAFGLRESIQKSWTS